MVAVARAVARAVAMGCEHGRSGACEHGCASPAGRCAARSPPSQASSRATAAFGERRQRRGVVRAIVLEDGLYLLHGLWRPAGPPPPSKRDGNAGGGLGSGHVISSMRNQRDGNAEGG